MAGRRCVTYVNSQPPVRGNVSVQYQVSAPPGVFCLIRIFLVSGSQKRPRKPDFCSGWKTRSREGAAYDRAFGQHNALRAAGRARTGPPAGGGYDGGAHLRGARHRAPLAVPPVGRHSCGDARSWPGGYRPVSTHGSGPGVKPGRCAADLTRRAEWRLDACGPGRQASASRRPASGLAATAPGNGVGAHEVTARDHPAPAPAGLPLRQGRARPAPLRRATRRQGPSSFPRGRSRPPRTAAERRPGGERT
jgi:hypothetical protein